MPLEQFIPIGRTGNFAIEGEIFDDFLLNETWTMKVSYKEF